MWRIAIFFPPGFYCLGRLVICREPFCEGPRVVVMQRAHTQREAARICQYYNRMLDAFGQF